MNKERIKELKPGERFKIAGKILFFNQVGTQLTLQVEGDYDTKPAFHVPPVSEVEGYFESKGYTRESGKQMWDHYQAAEPPWTDKVGNPVLNWKHKAINVWFKTAEKIKDKEDVQKPVMVR